MRSLQNNSWKSSIGEVQHGMPRLLHSASTERIPIKEAGGGDACSHSESGKDWTGRCFGIREPERGETPLSRDEVLIAIRDGVIWKK